MIRVTALSTYFRFILLLLGASLASGLNHARDYEVLGSYPHYSQGFTQGLELYKGRLYESSGQYGRSFVVYGDMTRVAKKAALADNFFAEGLTIFKDRLYLLSWQKGEALVLNPDTLTPLESFSYSGEGWGLTHSDTELYMSDGSYTLRVLDPDTFQEKRRIAVRYHDKPFKYLNELEWHKGLILANQWQSDRILAIDAASGEILKILDMSGLFPPSMRGKGTDVFNGIAYDESSDTWLVTGKYWPRIYRVRLQLPTISARNSLAP